MTAQIPDHFYYKDKQYSITQASNGPGFVLSDLNLQVGPACTACWRGFRASYAIKDQRLILKHLELNLLDPEEAPHLNGVVARPIDDPHAFLYDIYDGLDMTLDYNGYFLIANSFISNLYQHMGIQPAWKYEEVHRLEFQSGQLKSAQNISASMAEQRKEELSKHDRLP